MISFEDQIVYIIYFLLFGMFLAITYDLLHRFLRSRKINIVISYIIQFLYWLGMVFISCLYIYHISEGKIFIYTFLFFFVGVIIYGFFLRPSFLKDVNQAAGYLGKCYKKTKRHIIFAVYPKEIICFILHIPGKVINKMKRLFKRKQNKNSTI